MFKFSLLLQLLSRDIPKYRFGKGHLGLLLRKGSIVFIIPNLTDSIVLHLFLTYSLSFVAKCRQLSITSSFDLILASSPSVSHDCLGILVDVECVLNAAHS